MTGSAISMSVSAASAARASEMNRGDRWYAPRSSPISRPVSRNRAIYRYMLGNGIAVSSASSLAVSVCCRGEKACSTASTRRAPSAPEAGAADACSPVPCGA